LQQIPRPTIADLEAAYYGEYPTDYEQIIKDYLHGWLVDPDSVKGLKISEPKPGWTQFRTNSFSENPDYGYICWTTFNSRNRMGGYVGYRDYLIMIKNGRVRFSRDDVVSGGVGTRIEWGYK